MKSTTAKTITIAGLLLLLQTLNGASFDHENFIKVLHEKSLEGKLNWFTCHAFSGKNEASKAAEAPCSVTKRREYYLKGRIDDYGDCLDSLYRHSAEIEIISSDNEDESEIDASSKVVYFTKYSNCGDICAPVMYNLYDFLFEGAAYRGNLDRIKDLFAKKKDARVTDTEARTRIFYNAVLYLKNNKDKEEAYEIFELLLKANFCNFDLKEPHSVKIGPQYMTAVLCDLRALKILLEHDPMWLSKFSRKANIFGEIFDHQNVDFEIANFVLDNEADPSITYFGLNALDLVLAIHCGNDLGLKSQVEAFAKRLREDFGLKRTVEFSIIEFIEPYSKDQLEWLNVLYGSSASSITGQRTFLLESNKYPNMARNDENFAKAVNSIKISKSDFDNDPEEGFVFMVNYDELGFKCAPKHRFKLQDVLFEAARCNEPRFRELLVKTKGCHVSNKNEIFMDFLSKLGSFPKCNTEMRFTFINLCLLLKAGFYDPDQCRASLVYGACCHMALLHLFISYVPNFLRNLQYKEGLFAQALLQNRDFDFAALLIEKGADPSADYGIMNALDMINYLENSDYWYKADAELMQKGREFAERLGKEFGMRPNLP